MKGYTMMDKRGLKRRCPKCGACFYDMGKKKFSCPKCHHEYSEESYQTDKEKSLAKIIKRESNHLNEEDMDTETLLQMTNTVPTDDDDKSKDDMMDIEESESDDIGELNDFLGEYSDEKEM